MLGLYKAKCVQTKTWIEGNLVKIDIPCNGTNAIIINGRIKPTCPNGFECNWSDILEETICRSTDYKDKRCQTIFENDILRVIVGLNENIPEYEYWKVIWSSSLGCFRIVNLSNDDETDLYMLDGRYAEIIRNEFDEP
jgi:hypothetical protein